MDRQAAQRRGRDTASSSTEGGIGCDTHPRERQLVWEPRATSRCDVRRRRLQRLVTSGQELTRRAPRAVPSPDAEAAERRVQDGAALRARCGVRVGEGGWPQESGSRSGSRGSVTRWSGYGHSQGRDPGEKRTKNYYEHQTGRGRSLRPGNGEHEDKRRRWNMDGTRRLSRRRW